MNDQFSQCSPESATEELDLTVLLDLLKRDEVIVLLLNQADVREAVLGG